MKKAAITIMLATLAAIGSLSIASAYPTASAATIVTPDDLKWMPMKDMTGAQVAVLTGDMNKAGAYTVRLKLADGFKLPLHWHPTDERLTVLSGTLKFYTHDEVNGTKMTSLPAGSFVFIPAGLHHYIVAQGETMIQSTGTGPFVMNIVK
jgi:quercetin dioxygenase-like cupin family protein